MTKFLILLLAGFLSACAGDSDGADFRAEDEGQPDLGVDEGPDAPASPEPEPELDFGVGEDVGENNDNFGLNGGRVDVGESLNGRNAGVLSCPSRSLAGAVPIQLQRVEPGNTDINLQATADGDLFIEFA